MALTYHINYRGIPGTLIYITGSDGVSRGTIIPAMTLDDGTGTGSPLGSAANPLNITSGSGASSNQVQGNAASGATDTGNPVKGAAVYNSTLPLVTTGQRVDFQAGRNGSLLVGTGTNGTAGRDAIGQLNGFVAATDTTSAAAPNPIASATHVFNGTTWDRQKKPNATGRLLSSAATTNATSVKATAGDMFRISGNNTVATKRYLKIYDKASAPTVGTDVPRRTIPLLASAAFDFSFPTPMYFANGIAFAITANAADADTTAVAAGDIECLMLDYA